MKNTKIHPSQKDIFTDQLINIESPHYNIGLYLKLKGQLDIGKFRKAVASSSKVFDVFKMGFDTNEPELCSYINEGLDCLELKELDFSKYEDQEKTAMDWMQKQYNTVFTLHKDNVLSEQCLIKIADDEHWLYFKFHHIITDAFGFVIWVNYISRKYLSLVNHTDVQFSYPSYLTEVVKASQYYDSDDYKLSGDYWKNKIKEKPEYLLHKKYQYSNNGYQTSANFYFELDEQQRKLLSELQKTTKANLQQLTIAALLIYLKKTEAETAFTFGIPYHKRGQEGQRNMLGMFSGILPFKYIVENDLTLNDLISGIKSTIKEDYTHRNYLISDLSKSLKANISESFLCDVMINYVPFNFDLNFGKGISANIHWLSSEYERSPLQICWRDYNEYQPLELGMHYGLEYFNQEEIGLFVKRIVFILEQFPAALNTNIESIDIIPPQERELLSSFNSIKTEFASNKSIVSAFQEQAIQTPDLTAVVYGQTACTYQELDERSNQLAYCLIKKGIKKETLVPICIERGVEMITGILSILKAGCAYVPIDPANPEERIKYILEDINASVILSSKRSIPKNTILENIEIVLIDDDLSKISEEEPKSLTKVTPDNLAYVIYTSGSTGKPKGVMVEHQSFINLNNFYHKILPGEQTILTCTYVFDVSVVEIFSTLLSGGCLNIPSYTTVTDPTQFALFLYEKQISTAYIHPMYLSEVATVLNKYDKCYLNKILIGVEPISKEAVKWYLEKNISIINGYGPTETTICATFYFADKILDHHSILPIGKPIPNYKVFILGNNNQPAPICATGEIYIGGAGLARGYLNRPGLTSEKFIKDPFSKDQSSKLYKTGDLGRWLTDGNIAYIGRIDNQVKIRGYRIELGEIESTVLQSELVKQCVVIAREDNEGNKRLIGYIVPDKKYSKEAIAVYLKSRLPAYMIPVFWVELNSLPLTANGKVNRKALPEPDFSSVATIGYVAPSSPIEIRLAAIWKKLLQLEKVGIHDNFFHIGGHSLLAVRLINDIKKETGKSLQVSELLEYSSIEKLARVIIGKEKINKPDYLVPIKTGGSNIPLYIVCGAGGTALAFYKFAELLHPSQPVYALQQPEKVQGPEESIINSVEDVAAKYIEEILIQNPDGPYALSGHCMGGIIVFEMAKQLKSKGKEVKLLALFDSIVPKKEEVRTVAKTGLVNLPVIIDQLAHKLFSKLDFELFLLSNHTEHAIAYKINSLKSLLRRIAGLKKEENELHFFKKSEQEFQTAIANYNLSNYEGNLLAFYAKERYLFVDKNRNINYKKIALDITTKNGWKAYASSVITYEIEGEHSTIFDPIHGSGFANLLQEHLNKVQRNTL